MNENEYKWDRTLTFTISFSFICVQERTFTFKKGTFGFPV
jgi:hypothetical protein